MSLLKGLFKIVFKWLFLIFASGETKANGYQNGRGKTNGTAPKSTLESDMDATAERAYDHLKQVVDQMEDRLDRKIEKIYDAPQTVTAEHPESEFEMNDLKAELAELKADIRNLKRTLMNRSESDAD